MLLVHWTSTTGPRRNSSGVTSRTTLSLSTLRARSLVTIGSRFVRGFEKKRLCSSGPIERLGIWAKSVGGYLRTDSSKTKLRSLVGSTRRLLSLFRIPVKSRIQRDPTRVCFVMSQECFRRSDSEFQMKAKSSELPSTSRNSNPKSRTSRNSLARAQPTTRTVCGCSTVAGGCERRLGKRRISSYRRRTSVFPTPLSSMAAGSRTTVFRSAQDAVDPGACRLALTFKTALTTTCAAAGVREQRLDPRILIAAMNSGKRLTTSWRPG